MSDMDAPADAKPLVSYRTAKGIVIVLSALIILALIGLVGGFIWRLASRPAASAADSGGVFALPPGAQILTMETQPGRLILHVRAPAGDEIDIVNTDDGALVARIKPAALPH